MQIPHGPPSPPGTCTNHSHCWHTSPCPCFQCHGLDKQVVLINFALKNEPGHMRTSPHDVFVCFMSREFYQARQRCCRNSWRISSDLLSGDDTSRVVCVVRKRFDSTSQRLMGIFQSIKHKQTGWRRQSSHSWMELQLPCFRLIPTMRRMSKCDHRDKNCTWRVQHKKRFWTSKGMLQLRRYCLTHNIHI